MSYEVITTDNFKKETKQLYKKYLSIRDDISALISELEKDPRQGDTLGKDCYKVRMAIASKGQGKSRGARVVTCVKIVKSKVFLLSIFDKSEQETIPDKKLDELLKQAGLL